MTLNEFAKAVEIMNKLILPLGEIDILLIRSNPTLTKYQKWKLTRKIRKNLQRK